MLVLPFSVTCTANGNPRAGQSCLFRDRQNVSVFEWPKGQGQYAKRCLVPAEELKIDSEQEFDSVQSDPAGRYGSFC